MLLPRCLGLSVALCLALPAARAADNSLFARTNLVAWCVVPFDAKKRGPEERAEMLQRLGFTKLAYDWRAEHVPAFEAEILALKKRSIEFFAFWDAQEDAFKLFEKHRLHPQIWKTAPSPNAATPEAKVEAAGRQLLPLVERTRQLGCKLGLYNHGGWGGEPENLVAVCEWLHRHADAKHVGIVYNFHHGHDHIARWPGAFRRMRPHLLCVNLNGMVPDGDQQGRKILHLGEGTHELRMMRVLRDNGWQGPIGIIDHRPETDSEVTLRANLRGLEWLLKEMDKAGSGGPPPFAPAGSPPRAASGENGAAGRAATSGASRREAPHLQSESDPNREVRGTGAADDPSRQTEDDWVDGRWAQTDIGQFLCATIDTPGLRTFKGIAIKVGDHDEGTVCYDTDLMRLSAAWTGGFVELNPRRYGLIVAPKPKGEIQYLGPKGPGWAKDGRFDDPRGQKHGPLPKDWAHFKGMYVHGRRVVLKYTVGGVEVLESPWVVQAEGATAFTRSFELSPANQELSLNLISSGSQIRLAGNSSEAQLAGEKGQQKIVIAPHANPIHFTVLTWKGAASAGDKLLGAVQKVDLRTLVKAGPSRWQPLATRGSVASGKGPLLIDTLTIPYDNPWKALFFTSGLDFFANGDIAVCTAHGDVWRVSGVDAKLDKLTWRRFATGLFQPLGLKIVDDVAHVLGRDQITRLHDLNHDGEADFYENFNNDIEVAGGGHSYATSLETDPQGNFWFMKCAEDTRHGGTILRVTKDGAKLEVIATGFRNPNGMGVSPDGLVTAADQQGNWVPETRIDVVKPGGFYGYLPMHKRELAPTDFDRPLVFVPRVLDNSAGGQAWIPKGAWGPLGGQMIHLSFGRCTMMAVLRDEVNDGAQGGVVALPGKFLSGVMRGRFNPRDQSLYVTGLKGWQTAAIRDGCLQRVRHTGEPLRIPSAFAIHENGIRLTFSVPLDAGLARDVESYGIEQWNFRWSEKYGSPDFKPSRPGVEGRDPVKVKSARLLPDGRSVFLETDPLSPVMQFAVQYNLEAKDGEAVRGAFYTTINRVGKAR